MIYTTVLHPVRKAFGLSCNEYCIADMVYHFSGNPKAPVQGWCSASRQYLADEMGISRQSVITIINRLVEIGLVERNADMVKTTNVWYEALEGCKETLQGGVKKLDRGCKETLQGGVKKLDSTLYNNKINNKKDILVDVDFLQNQPHANFEIVEVESLETEKKESPPQPPPSVRAMTVGRFRIERDDISDFLKSGRKIEREAWFDTAEILTYDSRANLEASFSAWIQERKTKAGPKKAKEPTPEISFTESDISTAETFALAFEGSTYQQADLFYYFELVLSWRDKTTGKPPLRKDWKATATRFMLNDYKQGCLKLKNKNLNGKSTSNPTTKQSPILDDMFAKFYGS